MIAHCIACGCDDFHACHEKDSGDACHWLEVDYSAGVGVCSGCPEALTRWEAGDREVRMLVAKIRKQGETEDFYVEKNDFGSIPFLLPTDVGDQYSVEWVAMTATEFNALPQFEHVRLAEEWMNEVANAENAIDQDAALRHTEKACLIERRVTALGYDVRFLAEQFC